MPHISTKQLKRKVFLKISDQLVALIAEVIGKDKSRSLISELLTETERIMLAKRLAVIFLIDRGFSIYKIQKLLKVSPSTVARFYRTYEAGKYRFISGQLSKKGGQKREKIVDTLENILFYVLPPRVGKDRRLLQWSRRSEKSKTSKPYDIS